VFKRGRKQYFQNWYLKTLLNTKEEDFIKGEFCLVKGKAFKTRGENFKSYKCFSKILFIYLWLVAKCFWKDFTKELAKTKHVVQAWSKMLKIKETIHAYLMSIYIGSILSNLCTYNYAN
jgi:hypothetical protein